MQLRVDGTPVELAYLFFKDAGGQIVQILIPTKGSTPSPLHAAVYDALKKVVDVMERTDVEECCTEVRVLNGTFLHVIDLIRAVGGLSVIEVDPPQPTE